MISMKRSFLFLVVTFYSFSTMALDTYIYFAHYPGTPKSLRHGYTIKSVGPGQDMYGVYNPGVVHLLKDVADVDLVETCPSDYVRVHWEASLRQSYQDFVVTRDDKPSVKARFRWYKPYSGQAYVTVFSNPEHALNFYKYWVNNRRNCKKPYGDDLAQDTLLYVN